MVFRSLCIAATVTLALSGGALGQSQPSTDWNGNFQFRSQSERANDLTQADLIERREDGYYGQWSQNYTGYNSFYNTSNIGSITTTSIDGSGNNINTDNVNCGGVAGSVSTNGGSGHSDAASGGCPQ